MDALLAQLRNPVLPEAIGGGANPDYHRGGAAVGGLISGLVGGMFIVAFLITFIYLITGGFYWITSSGDKANLEHARNKIIHAILGLIIVASVFAVINLLSSFLGVDLLNMPVPCVATIDGSPCP